MKTKTDRKVDVSKENERTMEASWGCFALEDGEQRYTLDLNLYVIGRDEDDVERIAGEIMKKIKYGGGWSSSIEIRK